ncbi:MAG: zinc ribbon domain-containing protein [Candidatus Methanoculleus thermohydrogenotrophicum]|jgi:hypothetical protein|nr:transposase [Candidatus Methanoculleus thermohydrogenotrophicum]
MIVAKTLSDRVHSCPHCGLAMDRDQNAAFNIMRLGLQSQGCPRREKGEQSLLRNWGSTPGSMPRPMIERFAQSCQMRKTGTDGADIRCGRRSPAMACDWRVKALFSSIERIFGEMVQAACRVGMLCEVRMCFYVGDGGNLAGDAPGIAVGVHRGGVIHTEHSLHQPYYP